MKRRPTIITILAVAFILLGLLSFAWGLLVFGIGGMSALFGSVFGANNVSSFGASSSWTGFLHLLSGAVEIAAGIGLLTLKKWGWYIAVISVGLSVLQGLLGLFQGGIFAFMCGAIWLAVPGFILFYLLKIDTRKLFGVGA